MKNLYIKFKEELKNGDVIHPDSPSLKEACKEAERLGYKKFYTSNAIGLAGYGILCMDSREYYFTSACDEEENIDDGFTEYIIPTEAKNIGVKKYRLLKDIKFCNAGQVFEINKAYPDVTDMNPRFAKKLFDLIGNDGEYFEEVIEKKEVGNEGFADLCKPLIKYLNDNYHPHTKIIIDNSSAELVEGLKFMRTDECIKD